MNALKLDCDDLRARSPRNTYLPVAESRRAVPGIDVTRPVRIAYSARASFSWLAVADGKFAALNIPFAGSVFVSNPSVIGVTALYEFPRLRTPA